MSTINVKHHENFEEYYEVVYSNISDDIVNDPAFKKANEDFFEMIYNMHYINIPENKAVVIIEKVFSSFKKHLNQNEKGKRKKNRRSF